MNSVSLARIMYGTNEDLHAPHSMNSAGISSLVGNSAENAIAAPHATSTLGGILRKAWAILHHKD